MFEQIPPMWAQQLIAKIERKGMAADERGPFYDEQAKAVRVTLQLFPGSAETLTIDQAVERVQQLAHSWDVGAQVSDIADVYDPDGDRWEIEALMRPTPQQMTQKVLDAARRYLARPAVMAERRNLWECGMDAGHIATALPEAHAGQHGVFPRELWVMALRAVLEQEASVASERRAA